MTQPKTPVTEVWQRGPVPGVDPLLMPVAHALLQVQEDLRALSARVADAHAWSRPGGAASIAFHVRHIAGAGIMKADHDCPIACWIAATIFE